ncbi:hypothetical protein IM42_00580 [Fervidobacterium sp. SC_NGM5_O18]|uniref:Polymer-forming cytoskeletal protein n=1 Tax=Fervidobacterium pennivorans TaxID=93466 RepID=A0A172T332_FERPE|nr:hypothetical protein [Fervidobacterium pennivorans]ANE41366.1 hypothetical protein JM64_04785 [Fervidobacterium pennivorans]PHJ13379.1 hypothetical protein IM42_00580 [Fervidobacterium sp. SC_NGM5_O18]
MGELPNDLLAILQALARKEITVDEAEQLIEAIMDKRTEERRKGSKSYIGRDFIINPGEEYFGKVEVVNGKAIINGRLIGDLEVVFGELIFSGEVAGNVELVGTNIVWNGGHIAGNLEMVGCSYKGAKPIVDGKVNEVNNFFINGVLGIVRNLVVKHFLSGIKIEE